MKNKIFKPLFLAALLPVLAGCSILDNAIAGVALNMVFASELLLNHATMSDGEFDIASYESDKLPTTEAKRAELTYGLEALAMPKYVAVSQMGFDIEIDFTLEFSAGAEALFFMEVMSTGEESEEAAAEASVQILYPVGTQTKPESLDTLSDWVSVERLVDLKRETSKDVSITIKGTAKNKTKSKTFYFNLNSDDITVPGGGEIDIEPDLALLMTEVGEEGTLDLTITPAELVAGKKLPLQIIWADFTFGESQTGTATVSIKNLATLNLTYDFVLPESDTLELVSNETVAIYEFDIRLKTGLPTPTEALVLTVAATVIV